MKTLIALLMTIALQPAAFANPSYTADENHLPDAEIQREQQRLESEASVYEENVQKQESRNKVFEDENSQVVDPEYDISEDEIIEDAEIVE
ncbi:MAG TPA: hypothetical protein VNJ01_07510 [Bacteriovoracaceae bacterium]|nr:hypothetical protein [Bacteriovoracaceae bacterium]